MVGELFCDTHVHIYPFFDVRTCLQSARRNLHHISEQFGSVRAVLALCLTERADCDFFRTVAERGEVRYGELSLIHRPETGLLHLQEYPLVIFPGRQIITAERLEVLALGTDVRVEDGTPVEEAIDEVHAAHGTPVLPWALGKWCFHRGQIVRGLLDSYLPKHLVLADTALLPQRWWSPSILRRARRRGYQVLAGTDPLPLPGEETRIGAYCSRTTIDSEESVDLSFFRRPRNWRTVGVRLSPTEVLQRQLALRRAKKRAC